MSAIQPNLSQITIPKIGEDPVIFYKEASQCFEAITSISNEIFSSANEARQAKYFKLRKLNSRFKEVTQESAEIKGLHRQIKKEMRTLRTQFQTNSHWLALTTNQSHFVEIEPNISKRQTPRIKINADDLQSTFKDIKKLPRGVEKIRALQFLSKQVDPSSDEATALLQAIQQFAEQHLTLPEKILALKQISWRDRDADQLKDLHLLVDPTGQAFAEHFLAHSRNPQDLVNYLSVVLRDRHFTNPTRTPLALLKSWPMKHSINDTQTRKDSIIQLLKMKKSLSIDSPFTQLTAQYLFNVLDPSGVIRCHALKDLCKTPTDFALEVGEIIHSLEMFELETSGVLGAVRIPAKLPPLPQKESFKSILIKMESEVLSSAEMKYLVACLKTELSLGFARFDMKTYLREPKRFGELYGKRLQLFSKLAEYYRLKIRAVEDTKKQGAMIQNLLNICCQLTAQGEFEMTFYLYAQCLDNTKISCEKGWELALKKCQKQETFMQKIADPSRNMKNIRKFIQNRQEGHVLCIPFMAILGKDLEQLGEQVKQPRNNMREALEADIQAYIPKFYSLLAPKDEDLNEWADNHLFDDWAAFFKALSEIDLPKTKYEEIRGRFEDFLMQETELKYEIGRRFNEVYANWLALKIVYESSSNDKEASEFFDYIQSLDLEID
jgi:hypothetical protein